MLTLILIDLAVWIIRKQFLLTDTLERLRTDLEDMERRLGWAPPRSPTAERDVKTWRSETPEEKQTKSLPPEPEEPRTPAPEPVPLLKPTFEPVEPRAQWDWHSVEWEKFMGVKLFAWLGGFALFLGMVFFVKYSI